MLVKLILTFFLLRKYEEEEFRKYEEEEFRKYEEEGIYFCLYSKLLILQDQMTLLI